MKLWLLTVRSVAVCGVLAGFGCQFSSPPQVPETADQIAGSTNREPASAVAVVEKPAIEDPNGKELSGYSTLENCNLLVPDAPDVSPSEKSHPDWCKTNPKYKAEYLSARAGQEIWVKATAGNSRFHMYNYEQKIGVLIDWWKVLRSDERYGDRFAKFGLMNDPDCCSPNVQGDCERKFNRSISPAETYGFDYCPGDATLNSYIGKTDRRYEDPACHRFQESGSSEVKSYSLEHSSCNLEFGTSSGIVGFRKFPNPRFDRDEWNRRSQGQGYSKISELKLFSDHSLEAPYRIGMACAACHIGFNPVNSPVGFDAMKSPSWANLLPHVGNPFARVSEIMATGMDKHSVEWQGFTHARPGTVDTSAQPNDFINNPGTFNAIFNVPQRPKFVHQVHNIYNRLTNKFVSDPKREVYHILKGGEDSVGAEGAVQRVYINIGSCSEECWTNHLTDLHELDPTQRGYGQTPFNMRQCQNDCANYRAIEARVYDVFNFFKSVRPTDLKDAVASGSPSQLISKIESNQLVANPPATLQFRQGDVARGQIVFAEQCAKCHSSQSSKSAGNLDYGHATTELFQNQLVDKDDFFKSLESFTTTLPNKPSLRVDFLSNDKLVEIGEIGTYMCRALHSNHMMGHVYQNYASENYHQRRSATLSNDVRLGLNAGVPAYLAPSLHLDDRNGPGFLRNPSLINVWATAPYFHNNALGPELRAPKFNNPANDLFVNPYVSNVDASNYAYYSAAVPDRLNLFARSIDQLLTSEGNRPQKISRTNEDIEVALTPDMANSFAFTNKLFSIPKVPMFKLSVPAGIPVVLLGSFRHKEFVADLYDLVRDHHVPAASVLNKYPSLLSELTKMVNLDLPVRKISFSNAATLQQLLIAYGNCVPVDRSAKVNFSENMGHEFGVGVSDPDKQALKAFLLTL